MPELADGKEDLFEQITYLTNKRAANDKIKKDMRAGNFETVKKQIDSGGNLKKLKKLDDDTGDYSVQKTDRNLNQIIQQTRTKLNISQKDMAKKLNIDNGTYNKYESGALKIDIKHLLKMQKILKVKITGNKSEWGNSI
jgi:ribosome-binding protein aMBF1 (putative translation factor)